MTQDTRVDHILKDATDGRPITKAEAVQLLALPANSQDAGLLRATATIVSRRRFANSGLLLGRSAWTWLLAMAIALSAFSASRTHQSKQRFWGQTKLLPVGGKGDVPSEVSTMELLVTNRAAYMGVTRVFRVSIQQTTLRFGDNTPCLAPGIFMFHPTR